MLVSLMLVVGTALAATPEPASTDSASTTGVRGEKMGENKLTYEVSLRARYMGLPKSFMDLWDTRAKDEGWALSKDAAPDWDHPRDRPTIHGIAYGLEVAFRKGNGGGAVFFDWVDSNMKEGYWDDRDDNPAPEDFLDGDYLVPAKNLGIIMFGGDYQYEVPIVKPELTNNAFAMHFHVGTGAGLALMVGKLDRWVPGENDEPSFQLYDQGDAPNSEKKIPRVLPVVDLNVGLKFTFADRLVLRVEGGLHTLLYGGGSLGMRF